MGRRASILCAGVALAAGCSGGEAPGPEAGAAAWFTEITAASGLAFVHESGAAGEFLLPEIMGGGVALLDAQGDGRLDAYLVNGSRPPAAGTAAAATDRFFRQTEAGTFVDATEEAGLGDPGVGMGVAVGDADNDGDPDLYVTNLGPDHLYRNGGDGRFVDDTRAARLAVDGWSSSAAFFDYDRDGRLDLYVVQYVAFDLETICHDPSGRVDYCGPKSFPPVSDVLLRNDGRGGFGDASEPAGITSVAGAGLGLVCADFDLDGWQDVYVANDAYANQLWRNAGDGTFADEALFLGAAVNLSGQPEAGMGVVAADFDCNGRLDLFMTHLGQETNTLYLDQKGGGFRDATSQVGLGASSMRFTGFGTAAVDLDLDADLDLVVLNGGVVRGAVHAGCELSAPWDVYAEPNLLYRNQSGTSFELVTGLGGTLTSAVEISRGLATGDVDGDGDLDLLVGNVAGPARLYRNDVPPEGHRLTVRCVHPGWRRDAIGARVEVRFAGGRRSVALIGGGSSYQSSSPPLATFGLGAAAAYEELLVHWPDGTRERFPGGEADAFVELVHGRGEGGG